MEEILKAGPGKTVRLNGDDPADRGLIENFIRKRLESITAGDQILFIDEAQKFNDIGNVIKIFTDQIKNIQVIATGSSSFDLPGRTSESLTGRKYEYNLFPLMFSELVEHLGFTEKQKSLHERLIYGSYPEFITNLVRRREIL